MNAAALKEQMDKFQLNWRSFTDQPRGPNSILGPIASRWNLLGTPTLYVVDHRGVIRHKWLGAPDEIVIDEVVEKLVRQAEGDRRKEPR